MTPELLNIVSRLADLGVQLEADDQGLTDPLYVVEEFGGSAVTTTLTLGAANQVAEHLGANFRVRALGTQANKEMKDLRAALIALSKYGKEDLA